MGCKNIIGGFKVVSLVYYDEYYHMYKLGKTPSLERKGFVTMVVNVHNTNVLLCQFFGHTKLGL